MAIDDGRQAIRLRQDHSHSIWAVFRLNAAARRILCAIALCCIAAAIGAGASQAAAAIPTLVKDIFSGASGSSPTNLTNVNGKLFFSADDGTNGRELWISDGTEAGTKLVRDIRAGGSSNPTSLTAISSKLFFAATDGVNGIELWSSDGTSGGTNMVKDIRPGVGNSLISEMTASGGRLFFSARDDLNIGIELWISDGTSAGTKMVKDIYTGASNSSMPTDLTDVGGTLFFQANDGTNGAELWKSNGTEVGTTMITDIRPGASGSTPVALTNVNGTLFFRANDGVNGVELWKSNGAAATTSMVKDIFSGASSSTPDELTNVNGVLYFSATDSLTNGVELWKSNGTSAGTVMVRDINPAAGGSSNPANLTDVNGSVFFTADDGVNGIELWKSDGTVGGTQMVKDINPGGDSSPKDLVNIGGMLFFSADDGTNGRELWQSDGTAGGTVMVLDLRPGFDSALLTPAYLTNVNSVLFFAAHDGVTGRELYALKINQPPTDIKLSKSKVAENKPVGTVVGTLTTTDPNPGDTHTYTLVAGAGDSGNAAFTIVGNKLKTAQIFDFDVQNSYSIRIRVDDGAGGIYEEVFTITITKVTTVEPPKPTGNRCGEYPVGWNGGEFTVGEWVVTVPPATVPDGSTIYFDCLSPFYGPDPGDGLRSLGHRIEIKIIHPDGYPIINPGRHVSLCLKPDRAELTEAGTNPYNLIIANVPSDSESWQPLLSSAQPSKNQVCAHTIHFSLFGLFVPVLPSTGFAPEIRTALPEQPLEKMYLTENDFELEIPKLGIRKSIAGVPMTNDGWDLTWLADQIGYLNGTAFPTTPGNSALTGHVYLADGSPGPFVSLNTLAWGDQIFIHAWGQRYLYEVREVLQVKPDDLSILKHEEESWLTLITCRGYDEKLNEYQWRSVVHAGLIAIENEP
jgi:LPXTG-site transpeptidase (sortase) family protein